MHARLQPQIFACLLISLTFISCRTSSSPSVCGFLGLTARRLISSSSLELQVALIGNMHSGLRKTLRSSCNTWVRINDACPSRPSFLRSRSEFCLNLCILYTHRNSTQLGSAQLHSFSLLSFFESFYFVFFVVSVPLCFASSSTGSVYLWAFVN